MRNSSLYPKLALQSIRSNRKFYLPYLLALLGDVAAIYIMSALVNDPGVKNITPGRPTGYMYVEFFMTVGMLIAFLCALYQRLSHEAAKKGAGAL